MSKIISIHSYRGGTGKSNTSANLAATMAVQGLRVGVVDTDIQSPGIYVIFGVADVDMVYTLNNYLNGECDIEETAVDVTANLGAEISGKLFLIPSSPKASDIAQIIKGYDVGVLVDGYERLISALALDALIIDTHPGLNNETLMSVSVSDALAIILRPDNQDYQGTAVVVSISRRLGVEKLILVANKVPQSLDTDALKIRIENQYNHQVGAILPHSDEMMALGSQGVFVLHYPDHPIAASIKELANSLLA